MRQLDDDVLAEYALDAGPGVAPADDKQLQPVGLSLSYERMIEAFGRGFIRREGKSRRSPGTLPNSDRSSRF